jgi:hypothetical protein
MEGRREERGARRSIPQIMEKNSLENAERTRERHMLRKEGQECLNMNTSVLRVDEVHLHLPMCMYSYCIQVAFFIVETGLEGTSCLCGRLHDHFRGLQVIITKRII